MSDRKAGDFTGLAGNYSSYRPSYSSTVLDGMLGICGKDSAKLDAADVGAGTGIWSRMLAARNLRSVTSVEPNDDMRKFGIRDSEGSSISWVKGTGESTTLGDHCVDLVTMASSFHWVDFERGTREFHRVLRPGGHFAALWNPRLIEANPLLVEIESRLQDFAPATIKRVSSGRSGITDTLTAQLEKSPLFEDVVYLEGRHMVRQSPEQYLGVWWSVNDLRVQAGEEGFHKFMAYVEERIHGVAHIETTYLTRAWIARRT